MAAVHGRGPWPWSVAVICGIASAKVAFFLRALAFATAKDLILKFAPLLIKAFSRFVWTFSRAIKAMRVRNDFVE